LRIDSSVGAEADFHALGDGMLKRGSSVASPKSIVSAPAGMGALAPTLEIFASVTTIKPGVNRA
jgi:hypothetical protein